MKGGWIEGEMEKRGGGANTNFHKEGYSGRRKGVGIRELGSDVRLGGIFWADRELARSVRPLWAESRCVMAKQRRGGLEPKAAAPKKAGPRNWAEDALQAQREGRPIPLPPVKGADAQGVVYRVFAAFLQNEADGAVRKNGRPRGLSTYDLHRALPHLTAYWPDRDPSNELDALLDSLEERGYVVRGPRMAGGAPVYPGGEPVQRPARRIQSIDQARAILGLI